MEDADGLNGGPLTDAGRDALAVQWLGMAEWVVNRWYCAGDLARHRDDLVAEGQRGVLVASRKFDPAKGVKFKTYAVWWARACVGRYVADSLATVRIPAYVRGEEREAAMERVRCLRIDGCFHPRAGTMGVRDRSNHLEPAAPRGPDTDPEAAGEAARLVGEAMRRLPGRWREAVQLIYIEGLTMEQAGARLGVTKERIRQLKGKALRFMRRAIEEEAA